MYIVHLSFYGKGIHGWQLQPNDITFQKLLRDAFIKIFKTRDIPNPYGCSRTDAAVHALHFIATMPEIIVMDGDSLKRGLNSLLPKNIRAWKVDRVDGFKDARALVFGKHYRYIIYENEVLPPFLYDFVWHSRYALNIDKMIDAARCFEGLHDFASFQAAGASTKTTERRIFQLKVKRTGRILTIDFVGDGFLKQMARSIAGTLVSVGKNKIEPERVPEIILAKDRDLIGQTLPGKGLYLYELFMSESELHNYVVPSFSPGFIWNIGS